MSRSIARLALLAVALTGVACTRGTGDAAYDQVTEAQAELQRALDQLRDTRRDVDDARAELDRARADLDRARVELERVVDRSAATPPAPPPGATLDPALAAAIQCPEEGRCSIHRSTLDTILSVPDLLIGQARIVPTVKEGQPHGFKLFGIRPASLPAHLGFKNGDAITAINGEALETIDQAMALYEKVRTADTIKATGERRGQPLTITLTITK